MASPCKKIKLSGQTLKSRTTQESKVTSTPKSSILHSCSPSLSTISSNKSISRLSDCFETDDSRDDQHSSSMHNSDTSRSNLSESLVTLPERGTYCIIKITIFVLYIISEVDYDEYFINLGRIKYNVPIWNLYKPLKDKSLYGQIVLNPANGQVSTIM